MHEAILYEPMEKKAVRCTACKIRCVVKPGGAGVCGVRQNKGGKLYLLVYGKASAVNIDPIEKKPLYHFLPGSQIFSIGAIGCNFACSFCQNWDLSQLARTLREKLMKEKHIEDIELEVGQYGYELSPERIVKLCLEKKVPSIAYTYNEPVIFFEYLHDASTLARRHGIRTVFVSNGYESEEALDAAAGYLDAMNIDLKSFRDEFYKKLCKARLQPVLDTIRDVHKRGVWLEVTTLVIPGQNDSEAELRDIAGFIASVDNNIPWHISAFHPAYRMKDTPYTSRAALEKAYDIGLGAGLKFIYVGNIQDEGRSATYCPNCGAALIRRTGYRTWMEKAFSGGQCLRCKTKIPGIWQ
ncbi:MAG: AmmeMemoRadiSam system radical SAM enzyme [Phaeodactylibacter sp.]|nr:AmmeMemoRadiSam system radical SAM enzyme [Phaeodactylibacter sp.]